MSETSVYHNKRLRQYLLLKVVELRRSGLRYRDIAERLGYSVFFIEKLLKEHELESMRRRILALREQGLRFIDIAKVVELTDYEVCELSMSNKPLMSRIAECRRLIEYEYVSELVKRARRLGREPLYGYHSYLLLEDSLVHASRIPDVLRLEVMRYLVWGVPPSVLTISKAVVYVGEVKDWRGLGLVEPTLTFDSVESMVNWARSLGLKITA